MLNGRLFPLNGPAYVSAYIEIDKEYQLKSAFSSATNKFDWALTFDTPGSEVERKMTFKLQGHNEKAHKYLQATFESPHRKANFETGVQNSDTEMVAYAKGDSENQKFSARVGFTKVIKSEKSYELTPIIEYNNADVIPYKVSGKILVNGDANDRKITFDHLSVEPNNAGANKFGPLKVNGKLDYALKQQDQAFSVSTQLDVDYTDKNAKVNAVFATKENEFNLDADVLSDCEYANGMLKFHHRHDDPEKMKKLADIKYHYKDDIVFVYGKDFQSTTKRFEMLHQWEYEREKKAFKSLVGKNTINIAPISVWIRADGDVKPNHIGYDVELKNAKNTFGSKLSKDSNQKVHGDWNLVFGAHANKHKLDVTSTRVFDDSAKTSTVKAHASSTFGTDIDFNASFDNEISNQKANIHADTNIVLMKSYKPIEAAFDLSIAGKTGHTNGKVLYDSVEYVKFDGELSRADTTTGKFEASVHELLTAHVNFNQNKGELKSDLVINFIKFGRKVKVDTKYSRTSSKLDFHNDFYYDFERDDTRHISIDSKNKYSTSSVNSVNEVTINGEKFELIGDGKRSGQYTNGKQEGSLTLRLPTQREFTATLNREVNFSGPKSTGHGTIKLIDTNGATKKSRSVEFEGNLKDGNREKGFFDMHHKLTLINFDGQKIEAKSQLKRLPKDQFKMALVTFDASGAIPTPVSFSVGLDEYCAVHAIYHAKAKFGDRAEIDFSGNYAVGEAEKTPATFKLTGKVAVPQTKLNDLTFDTSGSLKYPDVQNVDGVYQYNFDFNSKLGDKDVAVKTSGKTSLHNGDVALSIKLPETQPFDLNVGYTFDHQPEQASYKASGSVEVHYGNGKTINVSGDVSSKEHKMRTFHVSAVTPYEKAKNLDFTFKSNRKEENAYDTEVELIVDGSKYKLVNAVVYSRVNPSVNIELYYPNDGHSQLYAALNRIGDRKFKLSLRFDNINGFNLISDAELSYQSLENFAVIIDLDSAALKANKLHLDVHTKQSGNNRGIEFTATKQNTNILSGTADYTIKEEKSKTTIDAKGNVNLYDKSETLSFQLIRNTLDGSQNNETGVLVSLHIAHLIFICSQTIAFNRFVRITIIAGTQRKDWSQEHRCRAQSDKQRIPYS